MSRPQIPLADIATEAGVPAIAEVARRLGITVGDDWAGRPAVDPADAARLYRHAVEERRAYRP